MTIVGPAFCYDAQSVYRKKEQNGSGHVFIGLHNEKQTTCSVPSKKNCNSNSLIVSCRQFTNRSLTKHFRKRYNVSATFRGHLVRSVKWQEQGKLRFRHKFTSAYLR